MNTQYNCYGKEDEVLDKLTGYLDIGFYIDVGAHSPIDTGSITKYFYEKGWSGINIEPQPDKYQELVVYRPRDINLPIACGHEKGEIELFINHGLTTAITDYATPNWKTFKALSVPLKIICDEYVKNTHINFLKIDVEGFEENVIRGMDWNNYRPDILCIEAVKPMTTVGVYDQWERILINAGYTHIPIETDVYNRYYTSN